MQSIRCVYWQDGDMWLGYVEGLPDYITQGQTLEELLEHLRDLHDELTYIIRNVTRGR